MTQEFWCRHPDNPGFRDLVTGHVIQGMAKCSQVRADIRKCGQTAMWFEPGNLDARLEMLVENTTTIYFVTFDEALPKAFKYRSAAEKAGGKDITSVEYWDKQ